MRPSPRRRRPSLTSADQTVTRVDKSDHRQPPLQPQSPAKHGVTATAPTILSTPASTLAVNPSAVPAPHSGASRSSLNNPEQIRTNLNTAERPDQIERQLESPLNTRKKVGLNIVVAGLRCSTPHLTSPLEGGRDELGRRG